MADAVAATTKRVPQRLCLVCRRLLPRDQLLRLVKQSGEGSFIPNPDGRIPGKGIYFCRTGDCLGRLHKERRLRRQFSDKLNQQSLDWIEAQLSQQHRESTR